MSSCLVAISGRFLSYIVFSIIFPSIILYSQILMIEKEFYAETIEGLENFLEKEIIKTYGGKAKIKDIQKGFVIFTTPFILKKFYDLRYALDVYITEYIIDTVSNPINCKNLINTIKLLFRLSEKYFGDFEFTSFRIKAFDAGNEDYKILKKQLFKELKLNLIFQESDLLIWKPDHVNKFLIRITPVPLYKSYWRDSNFKGGLNSVIARIMIDLTLPHHTDRVLNICAGSGTLLIERCLTSSPPHSAIGIELDEKVLEYAKRNLRQSNLPKKYKILQGDCRNLGLEIDNEKFNVILGDLPFGLTIGKKEDNLELYSQILNEILKITEKNCRICLLTQDTKNLDKVLDKLNGKFNLIKKIVLNTKTKNEIMIHPTIYLISIK